jgi:hypothetical protein
MADVACQRLVWQASQEAEIIAMHRRAEQTVLLAELRIIANHSPK